jgi:SAM-dependent methyltransferase
MKSLQERRKASSLIGAKYYTLARHRDTILRQEISNRLPGDGAFLDAGCGENFLLARQFKDKCRLSVGADLFPMDVKKHRVPGVQCDLAAISLADETFDVLATRSVAEHLEFPATVFKEIARVLKPGGSAVMMCPNKWYYACAAGRLVPERAAGIILKLIFGKAVYDNFPTYYRANTRGDVARVAEQAGLTVEMARITEHPPDYLKLSPFLFQLGCWFDQFTTRNKVMHGLAVSFIFVLRKSVSPGAREGGGGA